MKKKILAVALAATMVVASAFNAFAATSDSVTITTGFSANSGEETLSGDFDVTYTFHDVCDGTNNWENFIVEFHTAEAVGIDADGNEAMVYVDVRADNYGWLAYNTDGATLTFGDGAADWDAWLAAMQAGSDCTVNVVRSGNDFTIACTSNGETFTATVTCTDFDGQDVVLYLTGENCTLTNIVFKDNTASSSTEADTTAASSDDAATTTAASSDDAATTTAASAEETGDVATFATVAIVIAAAAAIVVLKKRVTE